GPADAEPGVEPGGVARDDHELVLASRGQTASGRGALADDHVEGHGRHLHTGDRPRYATCMQAVYRGLTPVCDLYARCMQGRGVPRGLPGSAGWRLRS